MSFGEQFDKFCGLLSCFCQGYKELADCVVILVDLRQHMDLSQCRRLSLAWQGGVPGCCAPSCKRNIKESEISNIKLCIFSRSSTVLNLCRKWACL